jgi:uncharacterized zinc-type alcohol dehydrogenase-like protein
MTIPGMAVITTKTEEYRIRLVKFESQSRRVVKQMNIDRREVTSKDVEIDILFCGVCHSDLHTARNEWHSTIYPNVTGHEIVERITRTGNGVTKFKVGDLAAVGCMLDSCRECKYCKDGLEQYCAKGNIQTYIGADKHLGKQTFGGYSQRIIADEDFVLHVPENLDIPRNPGNS